MIGDMTGSEHYAEAERLLAKAEPYIAADTEPLVEWQLLAAVAHAVLSLSVELYPPTYGSDDPSPTTERQ